MDRNDNFEPREGGVVYPDNAPPKGDKVAESVGGVSGVVAGAAIGSAAGPIGTIIGGIAGAVGGWWAGHSVSEAAHKFTENDDNYYRERFVNRTDRLADRGYDDVRPAYQLGHIASMNPDYNGRSFDEIEPDLQHGWGNDLRARHGDWSTVRPYAQQAYSRNMSSVSSREPSHRLDNSTENLRDNLGDATRRGAGPDPTDRRF
jgi:hypothetical protein